jgi:hypothetical protein
MVFKPEEEALFELTTEWLLDRAAALPILKLGIHPEIERPAILNRSMPSTAGATIGLPLAQVVNERFQQPVRPRDADTIYNAQEQYT